MLLRASKLLVLVLGLLIATSAPAQQQEQQEQRKQPDGPPPSADCADVEVGYSQAELASRADTVATGVVVGAGPGRGQCVWPPDVAPSADARTAWQLQPEVTTEAGTNYLLVSLQCVHKGLVRCRNNPEDERQCIVLVEAPALEDALPCILSPSQRYMFFLQPQKSQQPPSGAAAGAGVARYCGGAYRTTFRQIFHSVRRPLGGASCVPFPCFPEPDEVARQLDEQCEGGPVDSCAAAGVEAARCPNAGTPGASPCADDPSLSCTVKACPGKFMAHNAILPSSTCYGMYAYRTSGFPVNCYGRKYLSYRLRQLALSNLTRAGEPGAEADLGADEEEEAGAAVAAASDGSASSSNSDAAGNPGSNDEEEYDLEEIDSRIAELLRLAALNRAVAGDGGQPGSQEASASGDGQGG